MNYRLVSSATHLALATVGLIFAAGPAICQGVGKTAAVNPASTASGKTLTLGSEIIHKERIQTSNSGSLQVLFLDRSTMNIGPNSDVVIDDYIFDPRTNSGKMSVSLGKGLMRFVGGQISHDGNATLKTPSATMGIRGAVGSFSYDPSTKLTTASNDCKDCAITLTAPDGHKVTIPPGFTATVGTDGKVSLAQTTQQQANNNLKNTGSKTGQNGGADDDTAQDAADKDSQFAQSPPPPPPPPPPLSPPPLPPPPPSAGLNATPFAMTMSGCCGGETNSGVPFIPPDLANNEAENVLISPVLGVRTGGAAGATSGRFMQYNLYFGGESGGTSSDHWMSVAVGGLRGNGDVAEGAFAGTGSGNEANGTPGSGQGSLSGLVTTNGSVPTAMTVTNQTFNPLTNVFTDTPATFVQGNDSASQAPTEFSFTQNATATTVPQGLGTNRPALTLQGFVGGIVRTEQLNGEGGGPSSRFTVGNTNSADFTLKLDPSNSSVTAEMNLSNKNPGGATGSEFSTASLKFGGGSAPLGQTDLTQSTDQTRSAYIDHDNFAALDQRTVTTIEGSTTSTPSSTINGQAVQKTDGFLINADGPIKQKVQTALGITLCQCEYTRWGFWSMTSKRQDGDVTIDDRAHMNLWVAGRLPKAVDVPTQGTASYSGHIVANVQNNNNTYMAGGTFTNTVNFGTRNIGSTATLDGATFGGTLEINQTDRRNFGGTMGPTAASLNRTMNMNGSFFIGKAGPVGEMGGNVTVAGANYMAGGIFAGKKN